MKYGIRMLYRIIYCENCDKIKVPEEMVKWKGKCLFCQRNLSRIILIEVEENPMLEMK